MAIFNLLNQSLASPECQKLINEMNSLHKDSCDLLKIEQIKRGILPCAYREKDFNNLEKNNKKFHHNLYNKLMLPNEQFIDLLKTDNDKFRLEKVKNLNSQFQDFFKKFPSITKEDLNKILVSKAWEYKKKNLCFEKGSYILPVFRSMTYSKDIRVFESNSPQAYEFAKNYQSKTLVDFQEIEQEVHLFNEELNQKYQLGNNDQSNSIIVLCSDQYSKAALDPEAKYEQKILETCHSKSFNQYFVNNYSTLVNYQKDQGLQECITNALAQGYEIADVKILSSASALRNTDKYCPFDFMSLSLDRANYLKDNIVKDYIPDSESRNIKIIHKGDWGDGSSGYCPYELKIENDQEKIVFKKEYLANQNYYDNLMEQNKKASIHVSFKPKREQLDTQVLKVKVQKRCQEIIFKCVQ